MSEERLPAPMGLNPDGLKCGSGVLFSSTKSRRWPWGSNPRPGSCCKPNGSAVRGPRKKGSGEFVSSAGNCVDPVVPSDGRIPLKQATREAVRELERRIITKVLQAHNWNRKKAAKSMSISYRALLYKIQETGLVSDRIESINEI